MIQQLRSAMSGFVADDCPTLAAALAYYTVFSLPPLLFLLITVLTASLSLFADQDQAGEQAREVVQMHAATLLGNEDIQQEIGQILTAHEQEAHSWWRSIVGIVAVLVGATGVLAALQNAFNRVWQVTPSGDSNQAIHFVFKRFVSLAMVLGFGFILLVSFILSTIIDAVMRYVEQGLGMSTTIAALANFAVSLMVIGIILAAMYRYLPDARIDWSDALVGAALASVLFAVGRALLQVYFEFTNPAAQLGNAAASIVALLIWVYYTSMIVLLGAEFSKAWAKSSGHIVPPEPGAVHTVTIKSPSASK
jgi:membrane protein